MRAAPFIAPAVLAAGLSVGWIAAPAPAIPPERAGGERYAVRHGGESLGAALRKLRALGPSEPEPPPASQPIDIAPPPPIDIAEHFRRELTAFEARPEGLAIWMVDDSEMTRRRMLRVGDVYRDGWRVASIDRQFVVLRKRREERRLRIVDVVPDEQLPGYESPEAQGLMGREAAATDPGEAAQTRRQVRRRWPPGGM